MKRFLIFFVPFIGLLGLLPHALFSADIGEWRYMANAWDEDSYALFTINGMLPVYRWLSGAVLNALYHAGGLDTALILMDVLPPMVAALLATLLAYHAGFRRFSGLFLASCLLLFSLALMTLCSAALVGVHVTQLLPFSSALYPDWVRMFVPSMFENFLNLYKSPDPQISLVVQFAALLLLLRHAHTGRSRYIIALALLSLSFAFIYVTTGIALIVAIGCYGALLAWTRRWHDALWITGIAVAATAFAAFWYLRQPPSLSAAVFLYHSRLPVMSASLLWAAVLAWPLLRRWARPFADASRRATIPAPALLAFACCLVPLITLNQQIITGVMVQSRTWDSYTNMPFVALALLMGWPGIQQWFRKKTPSPIAARWPAARWFAFALALWLCWGQMYVYRYYSPSNLDNLAIARAMQVLHQRNPQARLMLETMGDDSQVALRMGDASMESIAGYRQIMKNFAAPLSAGDAAHAASIATIKEQAFTYFDRHMLTPDMLQQRMLGEAKAANAGAHIIYFFSMLDVWRAASDHRLQNVSGMTQKIPQLVADYRAFLNDKKRRLQFGEIFYATRTPRAARANGPWSEQLVDTVTIGAYRPLTVYIYRMSSKR